MPSAIQSSAPSNPGTLHHPARTAGAANTAVLSWIAHEEIHLLAGPIQNRSTDDIAVHLINAVPVAQTVRVDFTDGPPRWGVIQLCTRISHAYHVRIQLQNTV